MILAKGIRMGSVWNVRTLAGAMLAMGLAACGDAGEGEIDPAADPAPADTAPAPRTGVRGYPTPSDTSRPAGTLGSIAQGATMLATLEEWSVTLSEEALSMGQVTIAVENRGTMPHVLEIVSEHGGRWRSAPIPPGGSVRMSMLLSNARYRVYCPLDDDAGDHSERGMETQLVVR